MPQNTPAEPTPNQPKLEGARRVNHRPVRKQTTVFPYRGKWRIQYLDHLGRNRTVTAQTKADAYTKLAEIEGHLSSGFQNPMSKEIPTFTQFAHYWLEQRQSSLSPITFLDYQATVNNWLNPYLGTFRLETINPTQIQGLYKHLAERFQESPGTIKKYHAVLLGIFSLAKRHGLLKFDPMELVKPPKLVKKPIQVFTPEEVTRILETAKTLGPKPHLRWSLALRYGLRQGETLGLKFSDFNLRNQTITIQRTVNSLQSPVKYCEQGLGELVFSVPGADLNKLYVWTSDGTEGWLKDAVAELDDRTHVTKVKEIDSSETSANYGYRNGEYGVVGTSTRFNTFESTELHGFAYVTVDGPHLTRGIVRFESPGNAFEFTNLINRLSKEYDENAQELQSETARFKSLAHDEAANDPRISQKDVILSELGKFYRNHWKYLFGWKIDSFLEIIES